MPRNRDTDCKHISQQWNCRFARAIMLIWIYLLFKAAVFAAKLEQREKKLFQRHWRVLGFIHHLETG